MTTIHANSPADVMTRLDSMILMSGVELPLRAIREMIASAVDVIVHTQRLSDGTRKVTEITEVADIGDDFHIKLETIFKFTQTGVGAEGQVLGGFAPTGRLPSFFDEMKMRGIDLSETVFKP